MTRKFSVTSPLSGAGELLVDFNLDHLVTAPSDVDRIEQYLPGAAEAFSRGYGSGTDGRRPLQWIPSYGSVRMLITSRSGHKLYEAGATIRRVTFKITPKSCYLTVSVRLEEVAPSQLERLSEALGDVVDYEFLSGRVKGNGVSLGGATGRQYVVECGVGDLITVKDMDPGIVVSVLSDRVVYRLGLNSEDHTLEIPASDVLTATPICGPNGGPAEPAIQRLLLAAPNARPIGLGFALLHAQREGLTELLDQGWAINSAVIALVSEHYSGFTASGSDWS